MVTINPVLTVGIAEVVKQTGSKVVKIDKT